MLDSTESLICSRVTAADVATTFISVSLLLPLVFTWNISKVVSEVFGACDRINFEFLRRRKRVDNFFVVACCFLFKANELHGKHWQPTTQINGFRSNPFDWSWNSTMEFAMCRRVIWISCWTGYILLIRTLFYLNVKSQHFYSHWYNIGCCVHVCMCRCLWSSNSC